MDSQPAWTRPTRSLVQHETQPAATASLVMGHGIQPTPSLVIRNSHQPTPSVLVEDDVRSSSSSVLSRLRRTFGRRSRTPTKVMPRAYDDRGPGTEILERALKAASERLYGGYHDDRKVDDARYLEYYMSQRWRTIPIVSDGDYDDPVVRHAMPPELDYRQIHFERVAFPDKAMLKPTLLIYGLDQVRKTRFIIKCAPTTNEVISKLVKPGSRSFKITVLPSDSQVYVLAALKISLGVNALTLARVSLESHHYLLWLNLRNYIDGLNFKLRDQLNVNAGELAASGSPITEHRDRCVDSLRDFLRDELLQKAMEKWYDQSFDTPSEMKFFHGGPVLSNLH
jgi:hypothetical protein